MSDSADLLRDIKIGARALKIAPTTLCLRAVGNAHIVARLKADKTVTMKTASRIREYIADHRWRREAAE